MDLIEQLSVFDEVADNAFDDMLTEMQERKLDIIDTARDRLIEGYDEYIDEMWTWDDMRRDQEWMEEVADAVNYKVSER